jgi:hypothetical protein
VVAVAVWCGFVRFPPRILLFADGFEQTRHVVRLLRAGDARRTRWGVLPVRFTRMDPKDWIALGSLVSTTIIAVVTIALSRRRERQQQQRDDKWRAEQQQREDQLRGLQRVFVPRVEFTLDPLVHGAQHDDILLELRFTMDNKGSIRQEFRSLKIRIRAIKATGTLQYWTERSPHRLLFPEKLMEDEFVPPSTKNEHYYFVEPGVRQTFTYVTKVPRDYRYLLVHGTFRYSPTTEHTVERVVDVLA